MSGLPQPLPLTPGSDIAGAVETCGSGVPGFAVGDEVYGATNPQFTGGYAEHAVARADTIAKKPRSLSFTEAASAPVIATTAWQMLFDHANVTQGMRVLVHGAAGNVGAYAVQLARWKGAHVIAMSRSADTPFVRGLGANEVVEYGGEPLEKSIAPVDVVVDTIGPAVADPSFAVLKPGGIIVSSVAQPSPDLAEHYNVRTAYFIVELSSAILEQLTQLFDSGVLKATVGIVLPLSLAREAHEMLAGTLSHPRGKIVLNVST
jgi:NADPH:quinone reductase-like Zn-dependent oxidoreductase